MTTDEVVSCLNELGLKLILGTDGQPRLRGNPKMVPDSLKRVLAWHKAALVERLARHANTAELPQECPDWLNWLLPSGYVFGRQYKILESNRWCFHYGRRRVIPDGVVGWLVPPATQWRPVEDLPKSWGFVKNSDGVPMDATDASAT